MKITTILFFVTTLQLAANIYSQEAKIDCKVSNGTIADVFNEIEKQSDFKVFYNVNQIDLHKRIDYVAKGSSINNVLESVLNDFDVTYELYDKVIVIVPTEFKQNQKVSGTITDASTNEPLVGVNVIVEGTTLGTSTDIDGKYTLDVPNQNAVLVFSFIGYNTERVTLAGSSTVDIKLVADIRSLDEVVVVGYGTMKKKDLTGSVSSLSEEKLLDKPAFNVAQAIGGKVAGVKIVERSGQPGGKAMIRVRGTNSINDANEPLFVVDGVVGVKGALSILNPNEIQTMDVLKDASATAIYGARGANGVIIITTKRGIAGKTTVEYNGYVTRGTMNRKFYVLDAEQMMYVTKQAWMNVGKYSTKPNWPTCFDASIIPGDLKDATTYSEMPWLFEKTTPGGYSVPLLGKDGNYYKPRFDTNWESEIFKPFWSNNHQLNIRGGNERAKFGTFLNYSKENGLLMNTNFTRFSGKVNGDINVNKWLDISTNLGVNRSREQTNDESFFSGGMARAAVEAYSILPIKYPNDPSVYGAYAGQWSTSCNVTIVFNSCLSSNTTFCCNDNNPIST
ncbi:MAG TPA: SusC/RagA family TonB-linked outer membrane protein, partial [Bacteroidales bacterium]|nr:SusC/RagA family TonB-linked outer membrane protein [Bacteroidales bacterium]